ncbi:MAG: PTS sugar transporter subunit IIC [Peptoniphilaceae bacterium]|nr:PTS sugar transporter subunit IIC [Peptoniphilaceae bacterium]MDD7383451.1 PTS sugar transporter subunit IIC [Peptoniphilaceae bacterium]MDY3738485.1 PTS sugar transporter subunit IIC [Peptoniphilaceae bacterium]
MKDKTNNFVEEKLMPLAVKLSTIKGLIAIRDGITFAMPLIIIGSLFMIIASFPVPGWEEWLGKVNVSGYLWKGVNSSFGLMGLVASFGIAYSFAKQYKINAIPAGIVSLSAFITVTPFIANADKAEGITLNFMGASGIFVAIVLGLINGYIYQLFINKNIRIKLPDAVPPAVSESFSAIIPGAVIITSWLLIASLLQAFELPNLHQVISTILGKPMSLLGSTLPGTILVVLFNSFFWFLGIHGGNTVNQIIMPVWLANLNENVAAHQAGTALPNIVNSPFIDNFVYIGGSGATIGLVIAIALIARNKKSSKLSKTIAPLTLVPGFFNINEPTMFGLPVVLNFTLVIPFILAPIANVVISYFAMSIGLVPLAYATAGWTMPPVISGLLVTGSIAGSILQIVLILVDVALYIPFYRILEKKQRELELNGESIEE